MQHAYKVITGSFNDVVSLYEKLKNGGGQANSNVYSPLANTEVIATIIGQNAGAIVMQAEGLINYLQIDIKKKGEIIRETKKAEDSERELI